MKGLAAFSSPEGNTSGEGDREAVEGAQGRYNGRALNGALRPLRLAAPRRATSPVVARATREENLPPTARERA